MHCISSARRLAYSTLIRIERDSAYSSTLATEPELGRLPVRDRALAQELTFGVLRRQATLDWIIKQLLHRRRVTIRLEVRSVLRLGLYQILFMDRIPDYAVVDQCVSLCRHRVGMKEAGFVNAVLRRVSREEEAWRERLQRPSVDGRLMATMVSHPDWLWCRWKARFGRERALRLAEANNRPPRRDFRLVYPNAAAMSELSSALHQGWVTESEILEGCYHLQVSEGLAAMPALARVAHFQALASQCIPRILAVSPGDQVLDVCGAPGGKTLQLSELVHSEGRVISMDRHLHRFSFLRGRLHQWALTNVFCVVADGGVPLPFRQQWKLVLLDAPCSGLGTIRRNPEIRWRRCERDLLAMQKMQRMLLAQAAACTAAGGRLLYSTCSTEPEENEHVIEEFLSRSPGFRREPIRLEGGLSAWVDRDGYFRTFPDCPEEDGFFAALVKRDG